MLTYEVLVNDFFILSSGHIALVGVITPNIDKFIPGCKADLYIDGKKVRTINILGEDRFSGGNESKREGKRAIRTETDISNELKTSNKEKEIRLILYVEN